MSEERELPSLSAAQLEALRRFALLEIPEDEMRQELTGLFDVNFEPRLTVIAGTAHQRPATHHFRMPEPGIVITRDHIANALERKRFGLISEADLVHWATILLMNDAYVLDPGDEDLISDWLNDISLNLGSG